MSEKGRSPVVPAIQLPPLTKQKQRLQKLNHYHKGLGDIREREKACTPSFFVTLSRSLIAQQGSLLANHKSFVGAQENDAVEVRRDII